MKSRITHFSLEVATAILLLSVSFVGIDVPAQAQQDTKPRPRQLERNREVEAKRQERFATSERRSENPTERRDAREANREKVGGRKSETKDAEKVDERKAEGINREAFLGKLTPEKQAEFLKFEVEVKDMKNLWSPGKTERDTFNAYKHWDNHREEFPSMKTPREYVEYAHNFTRDPPKGTETPIVRLESGDVLLYHEATNLFAVRTRDGAPRTMYHPERKVEYWHDQVKRTRKANEASLLKQRTAESVPSK